MLTELDGFDSDAMVICLAATNRPDVLDSALRRPGRFDGTVAVDRPDKQVGENRHPSLAMAGDRFALILGLCCQQLVFRLILLRQGREEILAVHIRRKNLPLAPDLRLADIAAISTGFTGADLANLVNEAALLAARANKVRECMGRAEGRPSREWCRMCIPCCFPPLQLQLLRSLANQSLTSAIPRTKTVVGHTEFDTAVLRTIAGVEKKRSLLAAPEKAVVARHEAGHAVVATACGKLVDGMGRVEKLSIVARSGGPLGFTYSPAAEDRALLFEDELRCRLATLLGGRAAEELSESGRVTTGAADDLQRATTAAYKSVAEWGLGRIGPLSMPALAAAASDDGSGGAALFRDSGSALQEAAESEVRALLDKAREAALDVLRHNMPVLNGMASALQARLALRNSEGTRGSRDCFLSIRPF